MGLIRFSRRFQRPTNLDEFERVWLAFQGVGGAATFSVNDIEIGRIDATTQTIAFDVTDHLAPSNHLIVEIDWSCPGDSDSPGGLYAPVVIEMREVEGR